MPRCLFFVDGKADRALHRQRDARCDDIEILFERHNRQAFGPNLAANAGEPIELKATNGAVSLLVPTAFAADLDVRTVNGSIRVDLDDVAERQRSRNRLQATVGGGGAPVLIETVNGAVRVGR